MNNWRSVFNNIPLICMSFLKMIGFNVNVHQLNDQLEENERLWKAIQSLRTDSGLQDLGQNQLQEWEIQPALFLKQLLISALFS